MTTLKQLLGVEESAKVLEDVISIESEGSVNGSVFIHPIIQMYAKAGHKVAIVSFNNAFQHYHIIGRKMGVDLFGLSKAGERKRVLFVDGVSRLTTSATAPIDNVFGEPATPAVLDLLANSSAIVDTLEAFTTTPSNSPIKGQQQHHVEAAPTQDEETAEPFLLVVDGVAEALSVGVSRYDLYRFVRRLADLVHARPGGTLVLHTLADLLTEDAHCFLNDLAHLSTKILTVSALATGASKDVHGKVTCLVPSALTSKSTAVHFNTRESAVSLFPIGSAAGYM